MPFQNEKAGNAAIIRILSSKKVQALQAKFRREPAPDTKESSPLRLANSPAGAVIPQIILAIDGGYHATPVEAGYPGAEIGYLTIASVLLFLDKLKDSAKDGIINPVKFRNATNTGSIDLALPGRGVLIDEEPSAKFSMRKILFEEMKDYRIFKNFGETLLETYEHLVDIHNSPDSSPKCPCAEEKTYLPGKGRYDCKYCENALYSTDALRFHELFFGHRIMPKNVRAYHDCFGTTFARSHTSRV